MEIITIEEDTVNEVDITIVVTTVVVTRDTITIIEKTTKMHKTRIMVKLENAVIQVHIAFFFNFVSFVLLSLTMSFVFLMVHKEKN